jgi:carboxypeptidase PM20D1
MSFPMKIVFANQWLFRPLVKNILAKSPSTNATIRTTMAFTILKAGTKENVLPTSASAVINFRILPGETIKEVVSKITSIVDDSTVTIRVLPFHSEPSSTSNPESSAFKKLNKTIRQVFPDCIVAPYLVLAGTDSRYFTGSTKNIFRFFPARLEKEELKMIHGSNEKMSIKNYREIVNFYHQLILNSSSL